MKFSSLWALLAALLFSLPAAAEKLDGVLPLVKDDLTAVSQVRATAEKHVLLYFGDHLN